MIVKLTKNLGNTVFMLQSVMIHGVSFLSWDMFKNYNNVYGEVFYRKLDCKRDEAFYKRFEDFIEQVQGNEYGLTVKQFILPKYKRAQSIQIDLEERQFFCSELIVKCYKELQVIKADESRASNTYTPQDLSCVCKNQLVLNNECQLMDDKLILFRKADRKIMQEKMKHKKRSSILHTN